MKLKDLKFYECEAVFSGSASTVYLRPHGGLWFYTNPQRELCVFTGAVLTAKIYEGPDKGYKAACKTFKAMEKNQKSFEKFWRDQWS